MDIVILAVVLAITFWAIIKKYNPTVTLLTAGLFLISIAHAFQFGEGKIPVAHPTGMYFVDIFLVITENFKEILRGLGMYIFTIGGFAYFIEKVGSAQTLVYYAIKPLGKVKSPFVVLALAFYFGVFLNVFIDSAAGLGLMLMTTFYPILRGLGASKLAAASVISTTGSFAISPLSSIAALNSELLGIPIHEYFFGYKVYSSIFIVLFAGLAHFAWHRYCERKALPAAEAEEHPKAQELKPGNPILALIPLIPIGIMFIPILNKSIKMDISTVMFASVAVSILLVAIVKRLRVKELFQLCGEYFTGMGRVYDVVVLMVAGQIFASGLVAMGAVTYLVHIGNSLQFGGLGVSLIFSVIAFLLSVLTGSSNAAVIAFANLSPGLAEQFNVHLMMFLLPLHDISILGRPLAPVAGVIIAVAGVARINVIDLVKRNAVPMVSTAIFAFLINLVILPILLK